MKGKIIATLSIAFFIVIISTGVKIHAEAGETVRVSTEKQLRAAMKNADVGTIVFRTCAYINVTIKSVKGSDEKFLIIDAPNASFNNKALFAEINIMSAQSYTESVSGNRIAITGPIIGMQDYVLGPKTGAKNGFIVAKKKQVESLTIYDTSFENPKYTLRKGAKVKNLKLVYNDFEPFVESSYNSSKKQITLKYTDIYWVDESLLVKLDKSGRIIRIKCKASNPAFGYDYNYSYDSNGNVIKITGEHAESGKFEINYNYSADNLLVKSERSGSYPEVTMFLYDDKGLLEKCLDEYGSASEPTTVYNYEYDKKGRLTREKYNNSVSGSSFENTYTYNSKGFQTKKEYTTSSGIEYEVLNSYNKAGDCITYTIISDGETSTTKHKYDELGNPLS